MEMTDILPVEGWAALEQEIFERFGVNAHVYNAKGSPFTGHFTWGNRLCPALRHNKAAASAICAVVNQALGAEVRATRQSAVEDCDAGLMVVCTPVYVGEEFVGMVGGCGGLRDGAEPESFLIEKAAGLSEDQVAELCSDMRQYTEDEAQAIARYIEGRVAAIVKDYEARQAAK
jgi:ligand-binding sensor protein